MKRLVCEMCGSTDLIKDNGVFVCQSCGCKYTVEEARKMMVEGTVEVTGTVKVDNSEAIDNYLQMAENALNAENNEEAENYANKIIEIEPQHAQAWFIKGKAAGWQTTGKTNKFPESIIAWINAYTFASEAEKGAMAEKIMDESSKLASAVVLLKINSFKILRNQKSVDDVRNTISLVEKQFKELKSKTGIDAYTNDLKTSIAKLLNGGAVGASNEADKEFGPQNENRNKFAWNRYTEAQDSALSILERAYYLSEDDDSCLQICKNYITIAEIVRDSCSYKFWAGPYGGSGYIEDYSFTTEAKNARTKTIQEWKKKSGRHDPEKRRSNRDQALKLVRDSHDSAGKELAISKYWENHALEKIALEEERNELDTRYSQLQSEMKSNPDKLEDKRIGDEISALKIQMASLGAFKGKDKKELADRIEKLEAEKRPHQEKWDAASIDINNQIKTIGIRRKEINDELTKDRGTISLEPQKTIELFDGPDGDVSGLDLAEYFRAVMPQKFTLTGDVQNYSKAQFESQKKLSDDFAKLIGEAKAAIALGDSYIPTAQRSLEYKDDPEEYKHYRIKFDEGTSPTDITLNFEAKSEDSSFKDSITYRIELKDETKPIDIANYVQIITSSITGICPDIETGTLEDNIVDNAYGFDGGLTIDVNGIFCTIYRNINSSLNLRLTHK